MDSNIPLVSVIIPCYNHGEFIEETIASVYAQSYNNIEIIVVNDGSNDDNTIAILKDLSHKFPEVKVYDKENGGLSSARNYGIERANGIYIFPLDADDIIKAEMIRKCVDLIQTSKNIKAVCTYVKNFGKINSIYKPKGGDVKDFMIYNRAFSSILYRKSDWSECGGYDEANRTGYEDWQFCIELIKNGGEIKVIKEPLFLYRRAENSMVTNSDKKRKELVRYLMDKNPDLFLDYYADTISKWNLRDIGRNITILDGFKIFIKSIMARFR